MNNTYVTNQQKFYSDFNHVSSYFKLLTQYYQNWSLPNVDVTYYSLDIENSYIDEDKLVNGAYELVGDLSTYRWRKILKLPVNNIESLTTTPTADEKGVTYSEKITTCWFPSSNQIECHVHDFLVFSEFQDPDNYYLRNPPLFEVVNVERSPDFDNTFYKISLKITYIPQSKIDKKICTLLHYNDYEKMLYGIDDSICLTCMINERQKNKCNYYHNDNTGLYFDKIDFTLNVNPKP